MRKLVLVIAIAAAVAAGGFAEDKGSSGGGFNILSFPPPVQGGNIMLDLGLGLRNYSNDLIIPPLFIQAEYALPVGVPISVGGIFSFYQTGWDSGPRSHRWTELIIAARANWHWGFNVNWLDFYTGLSLGYDISIADYKLNGNKYDPGNLSRTYGGFDFGFLAGAHFYISKTFGFEVETGYPYYLKAGIALKF